MVDFDDFPDGFQNALEIWADILFGDDSVRPVCDCEYLTEKPARDVMAGEEPRPEVSVWVHEAFSDMARKGSRGGWERNPTPEELASKHLRKIWRRYKTAIPVSYIDSCFHLHYTNGGKRRILEILAHLMGTEFKQLHDPEIESEFEGYEEKMLFTLSRTANNKDPVFPEAWTVRRFKPSDLFTQLETLDSEDYKVVTLVTPFQ